MLSQPCDSPSWCLKSHGTRLSKGLTKPHYGRLIHRSEVCDHQENLEQLEPFSSVEIRLILSKWRTSTPVSFWEDVTKLYNRVSHISWLKAYTDQLPVFYLWDFIGRMSTQQLSLAEKNVPQLLDRHISHVPVRYTTVNFLSPAWISNAIAKKKRSLHSYTLFPYKILFSLLLHNILVLFVLSIEKQYLVSVLSNKKVTFYFLCLFLCFGFILFGWVFWWFFLCKHDFFKETSGILGVKKSFLLGFF